MTPFFVQKEVMDEKIITRVKYGNVSTQIMMFLLKKVDDLRAREQENESERKKEPQIPRLYEGWFGPILAV